jgi:hypothetical protein
MPRKRALDPVGLSEHPAYVTDADRKAERLAEFRHKLAYLERHYRLGKVFYGRASEFNDAVRALNAAAAGETAATGEYKRLPPLLELAISLHARGFAAQRTGEVEAAVEGQDVARAAKHVGGRLRTIRNRPRADNLIYHIRGLMALLQDFSGSPVVPRRYRNSEYDPHFMPGVSNIVPIIARHLEPSVTLTQLVKIAEDARREWAGRKPAFEDYFPGYGMAVQPDGSLACPDGGLVAHFKPNVPTYFHSRG